MASSLLVMMKLALRATRSLLPTDRHSSSSHLSQPPLPYMALVTDCFFVFSFSGSSLLLRFARGEGAVRELDWRKVSHTSAATTAASARQRSTLLLFFIRRREEGATTLLGSAEARSPRARHRPPAPRRQSHTDQLRPGADSFLFKLLSEILLLTVLNTVCLCVCVLVLGSDGRR